MMVCAACGEELQMTTFLGIRNYWSTVGAHSSSICTASPARDDWNDTACFTTTSFPGHQPLYFADDEAFAMVRDELMAIEESLR